MCARRPVADWHALDFVAAALPAVKQLADLRAVLQLLLLLQMQRQPIRDWRRLGPDLVEGLLSALALLAGDEEEDPDALPGVVEALTSLHMLLEARRGGYSE